MGKRIANLGGLAERTFRHAYEMVRVNPQRYLMPIQRSMKQDQGTTALTLDWIVKRAGDWVERLNRRDAAKVLDFGLTCFAVGLAIGRLTMNKPKGRRKSERARNEDEDEVEGRGTPEA